MTDPWIDGLAPCEHSTIFLLRGCRSAPLSGLRSIELMRYLVLIALSVPGIALAEVPGDPLQFSKEQFDTYCAFKNFMAPDGEWKRFKTPEKAKSKFARNYKIKTAVLDSILATGERIGDCNAFKPRWEAALKAALKTLPSQGDLVPSFNEKIFAKRINWVEVNVDNTEHVVVWVSWRWFNDRFVEEEAAIVGAIVHKVMPAAGTLLVFARRKSDGDNNMFEAKVAGARLGQINIKQVGDFAKKRYWRFFEGIKFDESVTRPN